MADRAFSHAMTATGDAPSGRAAMPRATSGATNLRMCAPTAVVTTSAVAISATTDSGASAELSARYPSTTVSREPAPTSCTV